MITTLTNDESKELLQERHIGRLGCIADNEPYVVPVYYFVEGDFIYMHSLPGRKIEALRAHPRACLQVDDIKDSVHWSSVLVYGTYDEIMDPTERARILNGFLHRFPLLTPVESAVTQDAFTFKVIAFRIHIDKMTGLWEG